MNDTYNQHPWHVVPVNDLREHVSTKKCWCKPLKKDGIYIHNALDKRELYETGQIRKH